MLNRDSDENGKKSAGTDKDVNKTRTAFFPTTIMIVVRSAEILGTGFWILRLTLVGIQYFIESSVQEKVNQRAKIRRTLIFAVLWFVLAYLVEFMLAL